MQYTVQLFVIIGLLLFVSVVFTWIFYDFGDERKSDLILKDAATSSHSTSSSSTSFSSSQQSPRPHSSSHIVIIGGGVTGLCAARRLAELGHRDFSLLESTNELGGLASTIRVNGFGFDIGVHVLFSHYEQFDKLLDEALSPGEWLLHRRRSPIFIRNRAVEYPLQLNLWQLPEAEAQRALADLESRRESLVKDCQQATANHSRFDAWLESCFGSALSELFGLPYNYKVWATPAHLMNSRWVGERVATLDVDDIARRFRAKEQAAAWGPNALFRYPVDGAGALWQRVAERLQRSSNAQILLNTTVESINADRHVLKLSSGKQLRYGQVLSTMPMDRLLDKVSGLDRVTFPAADANVTFVRQTVHLVGFGIDAPCPDRWRGSHWVYFPEPDIPFYRASLLTALAPKLAPHPHRQCTILTETSSNEHFKQMKDRAHLVDRVAAALRHAGLLPADPSLVLAVFNRTFDYGYPVPYYGRDKHVHAADAWLKERSIYSRGRFGAWKYEVANQDHSCAMGIEAVDSMLHSLPENTFYEPNKVNAEYRPHDTRGQRRLLVDASLAQPLPRLQRWSFVIFRCAEPMDWLTKLAEQLAHMAAPTRYEFHVYETCGLAESGYLEDNRQWPPANDPLPSQEQLIGKNQQQEEDTGIRYTIDESRQARDSLLDAERHVFRYAPDAVPEALLSSANSLFLWHIVKQFFASNERRRADHLFFVDARRQVNADDAAARWRRCPIELRAHLREHPEFGFLSDARPVSLMPQAHHCSLLADLLSQNRTTFRCPSQVESFQDGSFYASAGSIARHDRKWWRKLLFRETEETSGQQGLVAAASVSQSLGLFWHLLFSHRVSIASITADQRMAPIGLDGQCESLDDGIVSVGGETANSTRELILVTGGLHNLGLALVRTLLDDEKERHVVIIDHPDASMPPDLAALSSTSSSSVATAAAASSSSLLVLRVDLSDTEKASKSLVKQFQQRFDCKNQPPWRIRGAFHLAAVARVQACEESPEQCLRTNVNGTRSILRTLSKLSASSGRSDQPNPWLVFASTREIFGDTGEEAVNEESTFHAMNVYARSKLAAETLVREWAETGGESSALSSTGHAVALRFTNIYGSWDDHLVRLVPHMICRAARGLPLILYGGEQTVSLLHIDDAIRALILAAKYAEKAASQSGPSSSLPPRFQSFNIAGGPHHDVLHIKEIAQAIHSSVRSNPRPISSSPSSAAAASSTSLSINSTQSSSVPLCILPGRDHEPDNFRTSIDKARHLLGWEPGVEFLGSGLTDFVSKWPFGLVGSCPGIEKEIGKELEHCN